MNPEDLPDAEKAWRLNTSHMTQLDSARLTALTGRVAGVAGAIAPQGAPNVAAWEDNESPLAVMNYAGGYLLTFWRFDWDDGDPYHEFVVAHNLSPAFYTILHAAVKAEVRYVRFDVDADECPAFTTFEWGT